MRRYLSGFGPASVKDLANWAGLPVSLMKPVVESLELRRFRDEGGNELVDLPRAPLPDADTPAPVRFLPVWDATLLAHARRTQILPEEYRSRVFGTKPAVGADVSDRRPGSGDVDVHERGRVVVAPFAPGPGREARGGRGGRAAGHLPPA